jgi:peroxiredoxin
MRVAGVKEERSAGAVAGIWRTLRRAALFFRIGDGGPMISWHLKATLALLVFVVSAWASDTTNSRAVSATPKQQAAQQAGASVGDAAPEFHLQQMNGQTISLKDLRGHPAVIIFWTSWCPICRAEAPEFNRLMRRHRASGIRVLGINIQESEKRTRAGIKEFGIRYPVALDTDASVARRYQVTATPTVIFIDANGTIRYRDNRLPKNYDRRLELLLTQDRHRSAP